MTSTTASSTHFVQMSGASDLLEIEPQELRFPFVLGKASSCSVRLTNKSSYHVGFWITVTNAEAYLVPWDAVMLPHSTILLSFDMKPPKESPKDMECNDRFYIYSVVVPPELSSKDLTAEMFNMKSAKGVERCILRAVYVYAPPTSSKGPGESSSIITPDIIETRQIYVPVNMSARYTVEMLTGNLLQIEPLELQFPFFLAPKVVLGKSSSCSLKLTNKSDHYVAVRLGSTCKQNISILPDSYEVVLPHSSMLFSDFIAPPTKVPLGFDDVVYIRSVVVSPGLTKKYITDENEMFLGESGYWVEECELRIVYVNVPACLTARINMSTTSDLIEIEPQELRFPFVLRKASSCSVRLKNKSSHHVGFWITGTRSRAYVTSLTREVLLPQSTILISFKLKPPKESPLDMECSDCFYISSIVVPPAFTRKDLTKQMFDVKSAKGVEECELRAVYVYAQPTSSEGPAGEIISSINAPLDESKELRTIHVPADISVVGIITEMITGHLLHIEPLELHFPFLLGPKVILGKRRTCTVQLTNNSNHHVAYRVTGNFTRGFYIEPSAIDIMLPHSSLLLSVSMNPPRNEQLEYEDKFFIRSMVVSPGLIKEDISAEMFEESMNWVEECELGTVYVNVSPQVDGPEEGSPGKMSTTNDLLEIEPEELRFPFVLGKACSCFMRLTNKSSHHVGFWIVQTNKQDHYFMPWDDVVPPNSTTVISFGMKPAKESPKDMECNDRFYIFSVVVPPELTSKDLTKQMFDIELVEGVELWGSRAVYVYSPPTSSKGPGESSSLNAPVDSMVKRIIYVPADISSRVPIDMITSNLLQVEPLQLQFPFELGKESKCPLQLTNESNNCVAFEILRIHAETYTSYPKVGVMLPHSTCVVTIKMNPLEEFPSDMECEDEFFIQSVVVTPEFSKEDITREMFGPESGNWMEECVLGAIFVPPPREGPEETDSSK